MTITTTVSNIGQTTATFNYSGYGSSGSIEMQVSLRPDFAFCVAPIMLGIGRQDSVNIGGFNQRASYYGRSRTRLGDGTTDGWGPTFGFRTLDGAARDLSVPAIVSDNAMVVVPDPILSIAGGPGTVAGFPADNLLLDSPVAWRDISSGVGFSLTWNTAGGPVDTIALLKTNIPEGGAWQLSADATQGGVNGSSPAYRGTLQGFRASINLPGRELGYHGLMRLPAPIAYPWWRLDFNLNPPPSAGLLHAEHLIVGLNRATKSMSVGLQEQGSNLGSLDRTRSGIADRQDGFRMRHVEFDISYMTEAQYQQSYRDLAFRVNQPVLIVPNSKAGPYLNDRILYGPLDASRLTLPTSIHSTRTFAIDSLC